MTSVAPNAEVIEEASRMAAWEEALGSRGARGLADRIAEGVDVNAITCNRHLPLARAAQRAGPEACGLLIDAGAEVNAVDPSGASPLATAIAYHQYTTVDLLLERGARTDFVPPQPVEGYMTPFQLCVASGRLEDVERFVALGEDLEQVTVQGQTLLQLAASDLAMRQLLRSLKVEAALTDGMPTSSDGEGSRRSLSMGSL